VSLRIHIFDLTLSMTLVRAVSLREWVRCVAGKSCVSQGMGTVCCW
jgi:hypothetical protein